jgi:hypothetical protein
MQRVKNIKTIVKIMYDIGVEYKHTGDFHYGS